MVKHIVLQDKRRELRELILPHQYLDNLRKQRDRELLFQAAYKHLRVKHLRNILFQLRDVLVRSQMRYIYNLGLRTQLSQDDMAEDILMHTL